MANSYTTYALAIERELVPDAQSTFDDIWHLIKSIPNPEQIVATTSRKNWILDVVRALVDSGYLTSFHFLFRETGTLTPQQLPHAMKELSWLLEQFSTDPEQFVQLLSKFGDGWNVFHIRQAQERAQSALMPIEWYGDYDDLNSLFHYLMRLSALFELAFLRNLSVFHIRCEMFLESRQA